MTWQRPARQMHRGREVSDFVDEPVTIRNHSGTSDTEKMLDFTG
jgi:hypothetical protein